MKLTEYENQKFNDILGDYMSAEEVLQMKQYIQHGTVTTYDHCENVARVSMWLNRNLHLHSEEEVLLVGAFLHDFYLYDWHVPDPDRKKHGFFHPEAACRNAREIFHISGKEQQIIESHMFPLTPLKVPASREAWIVTMADKYCSLHETLMQRKHKVEICR